MSEQPAGVILPPDMAWSPSDPGIVPVADPAALVEPADPPADVPVEEVAAVPAAADPGLFPPVVAPPGGKVVALPSGFLVALRNPAGIRARERQFVYDGMDLDSIGSPGEAVKMGNREAVMTGVQMTARIIGLLVSGWNVRSVNDALEPFGPVLPLPKDDLEGLADMPVGDARVLEVEAEAAQKIIMPDFSPNPSEASPTLPSAG